MLGQFKVTARGECGNDDRWWGRRVYGHGGQGRRRRGDFAGAGRPQPGRAGGHIGVGWWVASPLEMCVPRIREGWGRRRRGAYVVGPGAGREEFVVGPGAGLEEPEKVLGGGRRRADSGSWGGG